MKGARRGAGRLGRGRRTGHAECAVGDRRELARPPEGEEMFELLHDAQEAGADQSAQGGLHAGRSASIGA